MGEAKRRRWCAPCFDCLSSNRNYYFIHMCQRFAVMCFEWSMLILGPCLIVTVIALVSCETYWALNVLVPRFAERWSARWWAHALWIAFLCFNGLFNYFSCVLTNPGTHDSTVYRDLVRAASVDGTLSAGDWLDYARTHGLDGESKGADVEAPTSAESKRLTSGARPPRSAPAPGFHTRLSASSWLERGPYEWGYCKRSAGPKAPRSHYDHVTRKLVLNMDHYCPWMFNCVGFANYRYFVLFLFYVSCACAYGICLTFADFVLIAGPRNPRMIRGVRVTNQMRTAVMFTFVLAVSVGLAVAILFGWHCYLVLTAQTTIEFYGNHTLRLRARVRGERFRNPYDRGYANNFRQVFGAAHPLIAVLPSSRKPPGAPWPAPRARATVDVV